VSNSEVPEVYRQSIEIKFIYLFSLIFRYFLDIVSAAHQSVGYVSRYRYGTSAPSTIHIFLVISSSIFLDELDGICQTRKYRMCMICCERKTMFLRWKSRAIKPNEQGRIDEVSRLILFILLGWFSDTLYDIRSVSEYRIRIVILVWHFGEVSGYPSSKVKRNVHVHKHNLASC